MKKRVDHPLSFQGLQVYAAQINRLAIDSAVIIIAHFTKKGRASLKIVDMTNRLNLSYQCFYFFPPFSPSRGVSSPSYEFT